MQKLNHTVLSEQWIIQEIEVEIKKILKTNENKAHPIRISVTQPKQSKRGRL